MKKVHSLAIPQKKRSAYVLLLLPIVFLNFSVLNACSKPQPVLKPLSSSSTILAFGDSLTFGTGAAKENSYPAILQRLINIKVVNAGNPGELSRNGKTRLGPLLKQHTPSLVILCHGGNDLIRKTGEQQLKNNLTSMIKEIQSQNIAIILLAVPKPGIFIQPAKLYKDIAKEFSIPLEEESLSDIISNPVFKSDPVHPNDKGYRKLAQKIAERLFQSGAITGYSAQ